MTDNTGVAHELATTDVALNCGHVVKFRIDCVPTPGYLVLCRKCDDYRYRPFPLETGPDGMPVLMEYMWLCAFKKTCNQGSKHKFGRDIRAAYKYARRHSLNHPGHEVWVVTPLGGVADRWTVGTALFEDDVEVFKDAGQGVRSART